MYLHEVASDSYVLLQAKWAVGKARELIGRLDPTHVIVHRSEPTDFYYLYTKSEAIGRLANHDAQATLFDAFNLHESTATPTRDAFAAADEVPDRAVVMEEGRVVGFFDATVPPTERGTKRGGGQRGSGGVRPVPRSLVTQFPDQVRLAEIVSLLVSLSAEPARAARPCPSHSRSAPPSTWSSCPSEDWSWKARGKAPSSFRTSRRPCPCSSSSGLLNWDRPSYRSSPSIRDSPWRDHPGPDRRPCGSVR